MRTVAMRAGAALAALVLAPGADAQRARPIRVLIVSGGGYHDYAAQRALLEAGLKARLNVEVGHVFSAPGPERQTRPDIPAFRNAGYADGYDVVLHNECAADESDPAVLDAVLAPHRKGVPAVALHCAMHSFRSGDWRAPVAPGADNARWFALTGIQSTGHGPQNPITLSFTGHPIAKGLEGWTTPNEELYNNLTQFGVTPVVTGVQPASTDARWRGPMTVGWTHEYGPKRARVFGLTIAHNERTMADPRYLDLVARGVAWATGNLARDGTLRPRIRR